ncbi:MAG: hypothetical protein K2I66_05535 [Bacteroidales bacterium]|nr:hypothetical protein [Bacteroidales bacterium]
MNVFLLFILLLEAVLLFRIEKKMWGTGYTPLNFLMLPYVAILGITLLLSGRLGLDEFYYPSLIPWIIGLPVFALPGWLFFLAERRFWARNTSCASFENNEFAVNQGAYRFEIGLAIAILIALSVRLIVFLLQGKGTIGNEEFGALFSGNGWAGHLQLISVALLMLLLLDNRRWPTWIISAFILFFLFVYQVKSGIILPLLAVLFALLITERLKFKLKYLLWIGGGVVAVFFASYLWIYISGNQQFPEATSVGAQLRSITSLFVHYLTSGTLGLSVDMQQGILEEPGLQHIFTPFYNLWYTITGQPVISGMNPEYLYTGIARTNVRTFFGTLFVFTRPAGFVICCLLFGVGCQFFFGLFRRYRNTCTVLLCAWTCTVLFMGWFDFFPYLLSVFEIPFWMVAITLIQKRFINFKR